MVDLFALRLKHVFQTHYAQDGLVKACTNCWICGTSINTLKKRRNQRLVGTQFNVVLNQRHKLKLNHKAVTDSKVICTGCNTANRDAVLLVGKAVFEHKVECGDEGSDLIPNIKALHAKISTIKAAGFGIRPKLDVEDLAACAETYRGNEVRVLGRNLQQYVEKDKTHDT